MTPLVGITLYAVLLPDPQTAHKMTTLLKDWAYICDTKSIIPQIEVFLHTNCRGRPMSGPRNDLVWPAEYK